jgi:GAF domain-containing protein
MPNPTFEESEDKLADMEEGLRDLSSDTPDGELNELFELSILCSISQALASTRDLDSLLRIVIDEVCKALITEGAGVLIFDENRKDLYWRQIGDAKGILAPQAEGLRMPLEGSIAGWVFQNNKPARVNDTSKDPRYYPEMTKKSGFDIRKVLQVPLNTPEKTIGVLMIMNKIGGDFTDQDEALATSMAGSIALAIENATVYERLKKTKDDLEMIYNSSMALARTMDLEHLLEVVINELRTAMEVEAAGVLLYDEAQNDLYWKEVQDETGFLDKHTSALRIPLDRSISGKVFQTGEPAIINNPASEKLFFKPFEKTSGIQIRNEILVPLNTREKTIGVLAAINKKEGQFAEDDVNVCSSLAGVVALAVENSTFFQELMVSYRELQDLNRVKTKVLNHLSHELRTPLAIIRGTLATMERKLAGQGIEGFDRPMSRMQRHVQSLNRLEAQVESIMMTGYSWEKRRITDFLQAAFDLMEVQTEYTPEIERATQVLHKWLETTFPARRDEPERIKIKEFGRTMFDFVEKQATEQSRSVELVFDMENDSEVLIPGHVLKAIMVGLMRNAVEATPDRGLVTVIGRAQGGRYLYKVKDTGIGIPEKDKELIMEGFYAVQETDDYSSGRPYSFNAGGKGIDLLRIRMFSELYGFKLSFTSRRCSYLKGADSLPGDASGCPSCKSIRDCHENGGSEFVVDFKLAGEET